MTRFPLTDPGISFIGFEANDLLQKLCLWMIVVMIFVITKTILNFKLFRNFKLFIIAYSLFGGVCVFFNFFFQFWAINVMLDFLAIAYILISSWKKLKGAQWALAVGLLLSILFGALIVIKAFFNDSRTPVLLTSFYFAFPLSLVVYVSMRFREIIRDVQENARQVVQMTEEKKEHAIKQQKILEEEVARQTAEIRTTLNHLKSTQSQLIQSEKMASLGELTAGIAHEIQNPLNFINNFSDVNKEVKSLK
jgi:signal transduction histidine kinase